MNLHSEGLSQPKDFEETVLGLIELVGTHGVRQIVRFLERTTIRHNHDNIADALRRRCHLRLFVDLDKVLAHIERERERAILRQTEEE